MGEQLHPRSDESMEDIPQWFKGFLTPGSIDTLKQVTCKKVFKQGSRTVFVFVKAPSKDQVLHVAVFLVSLLEDLRGRDELLSVLHSGEQMHFPPWRGAWRIQPMSVQFQDAFRRFSDLSSTHCAPLLPL